MNERTIRERDTTHPGELEGDQLEALGLETLDDLTDESALDSVRLDHDESTFLVGRHFASRIVRSGTVMQQRNSNWK